MGIGEGYCEIDENERLLDVSEKRKKEKIKFDLLI